MSCDTSRRRKGIIVAEIMKKFMIDMTSYFQINMEKFKYEGNINVNNKKIYVTNTIINKKRFSYIDANFNKILKNSIGIEFYGGRSFNFYEDFFNLAYKRKKIKREELAHLEDHYSQDYDVNFPFLNYLTFEDKDGNKYDVTNKDKNKDLIREIYKFVFKMLTDYIETNEKEFCNLLKSSNDKIPENVDPKDKDKDFNIVKYYCGKDIQIGADVKADAIFIYVNEIVLLDMHVSHNNSLNVYCNYFETKNGYVLLKKPKQLITDRLTTIDSRFKMISSITDLTEKKDLEDKIECDIIRYLYIFRQILLLQKYNIDLFNYTTTKEREIEYLKYLKRELDTNKDFARKFNGIIIDKETSELEKIDDFCDHPSFRRFLKLDKNIQKFFYKVVIYCDKNNINIPNIITANKVKEIAEIYNN